MYLVFVPMYQADALAGYLCISVRWIIYHIDTLLFIPTLVSTFHVRLISSSRFGVSCHLYFQVQLFSFVCLLIHEVSSESTRVDYSLLYLVKFYYNGGSSDQQLLFDRALQLPYASMMFFMIIFFFPIFQNIIAISFWSRVFPMWFSLFLLFIETWLCLGTSSGLVARTQFTFNSTFQGFSYSLSLS